MYEASAGGLAWMLVIRLPRAVAGFKARKRWQGRPTEGQRRLGGEGGWVQGRRGERKGCLVLYKNSRVGQEEEMKGARGQGINSRG